MRICRRGIPWMLSLLLFAACSQSTKPDEGSGQQIFIYAYSNDFYWDSSSNSVVEVRNVSAGGVIYGDPLPQFEYYALNNNRFMQEDLYFVYPGYISFGDFVSANAGRVTSGYDPLTVEVKTSAGGLSGQLSPPPDITLFGSLNGDTLKSGENLSFFWSGSDADFYYLKFNYFWADSLNFVHARAFEEFVDVTSFTLADSVFKYDGQISNISLQPMNGPYPQKGARGNMTGTGNGFFYYQGRMAGYGGTALVVGRGLPSTTPAGGILNRDSDVLMAIQKRIIGRPILR